ncbi:MAG: transaldolase family protein [Phycisphaerae bacterium]|nr:transaldolase family protein [Phycisphaerae bacterium]
MSVAEENARLVEEVRDFVREGFTPRFGQLAATLPANPVWGRLREMNAELWLDTGSIEEAGELWSREFSALTTNNTLLNREVQKGTYDDLVGEAAELLGKHPELSERDRRLEIAFILNARHGLALVERFDAYVSVEEHTDLAGDVDAAVACARRYHAICPERFIIKIPFTPAGLLATRRLSDDGVPVNHTLGFSARQNYLVARIGRPDYVNVFLGRLNAFVADNGLGDGTYVGERATLASQAAVRALRDEGRTPSKQIGASFRSAEQVRDLAGIDVMTMPPKVAKGFLQMHPAPEQIIDRTGEDYQPPLAAGVDPKAVRLESLWDIGEEVVACVDALEKENLDSFTPGDLSAFFADHACGDVLVPWTDSQITTSAAEGKIPNLANWADALSGGEIGLDSLMNLAGLNSFVADQKAMDERVASGK